MDLTRCPSPTLPSHTVDVPVPGIPIIQTGEPKIGELDEILGLGEGSLQRRQARLIGDGLGGDSGEPADPEGSRDT